MRLPNLLRPQQKRHLSAIKHLLTPKGGVAAVESQRHAYFSPFVPENNTLIHTILEEAQDVAILKGDSPTRSLRLPNVLLKLFLLHAS